MENPYIGMAYDEAGSALGSVLALRAAAARVAQQEQAKKQQDMKEMSQEEYRNKQAGWMPVETPNPIQGSDGRPTLRAGGDRESVADPGRTQAQGQMFTDRWGRTWAKPDTSQAQTYKALSEALEQGGLPVSSSGTVHLLGDVPRYRLDPSMTDPQTGQRIDNPAYEGMAPSPDFGVNVTPDQSRVKTIPGTNQQIYMPSKDASLREKLSTEAQFREPRTRIDMENFSAPALVDESTGEVRPLKLAPGLTHNTKAEKKWEYQHSVDEQGKATFTRSGEKGVEMWDGNSWVPAPAAAKVGAPKTSEAQARADRFAEREEDKKQRLAEEAQRRVQHLQEQEVPLHARRVQMGQLVALPNGTQLVDPLTNRAEAMNDALRLRYRQEYDRATSALEPIQQEQRRLIQQWGGGQTQQPAPAPPAAGGGRGAPGGGGGRGAAPQVQEGTIIRNARTGERLILKGGQWVPAQ